MLGGFTEKAYFERGEGGLEECMEDPDQVKEKVQPFLKALGFKGKVRISL